MSPACTIRLWCIRQLLSKLYLTFVHSRSKLRRVVESCPTLKQVGGKSRQVRKRATFATTPRFQSKIASRASSLFILTNRSQLCRCISFVGTVVQV